MLDGFLDQEGICLQPTFYMPENEELRWSTHNGIRKTLFFSIFRSVKYLEYKRLQNEQEFFELGKITPWEEGLLDRFVENFVTREKATGRLIQTQKWSVNRSGKEDGIYRIKVYHMDTNEFKAKVYPMSFTDTVRYLWFNRNFLRIL